MPIPVSKDNNARFQIGKNSAEIINFESPDKNQKLCFTPIG